ncbi:MAG TPA: hypothetical protein VF657_03305 [Actinoplanes sp.]
MHEVLDSALRDIRAGLGSMKRGRRLVLDTVASLDDGASTVTVTVTGRHGGRAVHLSGPVLIEAANGDIDPVRLIAAALDSRADLTPGRLPSDESEQDVAQTIADLLVWHRLTTADARIDRALGDRHDVLLVGKHGSGKSATVAARAEAFHAAGNGVVWLDLANPSAGPHTVFHRFLTAEESAAYLVVVDGVQANIPVLEDVFLAANELRERYGVPLTVLATGLTTLVQRLPRLFTGFRRVVAEPAEIVEALITAMRLAAADENRVRRLADNDLLIARMVVAFHTEHGRIPTRADLEAAHTSGIDDPKVREAVYWFASLGFFQIDVTSAAAQRRFGDDPATLPMLLDRSLIVNNNGRYSAGPRSRAALVLNHALRRWNAERLWGTPPDLAWRHLQVAGETAVRATLDRLDLIGAGAEAESVMDASTRYLLAAWDRVNQLERQIARECAHDATWNNDAGAAIFAGLAMAMLHRREAWDAVAAFVRGTWRCDDPRELPRADPAPTAERRDFPMIKDAMAIEDRTPERSAGELDEPAADIDIDRFHRSWMLGMLLCFEGSALRDDPDRVHRLQDIAQRQQNTEGFFYPRRVPWVTARIILGLCSTGLDYETSPVVSLACDWLLRPVADGGAYDNSWRSGTGSWNRQEATTAMCLAALLRARAPGVGKRATAMEWLWTPEHQTEWRKPGREIDLALVIEATSLDRERWRKAYPLVRDLLQWVVRALDEPPDVNDVNESGLRLPFVTWELVTFVWRSVISEFNVLLRDELHLSRMTHHDPAAPPRGHDIAVHLDDDVLAAWQKAMGLLQDRIQHELRKRDPLMQERRTGDLEFRAVANTVEGLRRDQSRAAELDRHLPRGPAWGLLREIDEMGERICGAEWPALPWPLRPDGAAE